MTKIIISILISSIFYISFANENKKIAYLVSDLRIPFWSIMSKGVENQAKKLGYDVDIYSAENNAKKELEFTIKAIKNKVDAIVVSPTNSSACVTILKLAKNANIPVIISDIGTDKGEYVSYISSNNKDGAYKIGKILTKKLIDLGWQDGKVGIVAIPQKRLNGRLRTEGFLQALDEDHIKSADIKQQITFSEKETYDLTKEIISTTKNIRAIWLQGSDRYIGALNAIKDSGKKDKILLLTFDAEPIFLELIPKGVLLASAMQQPYLMGEKAVNVANDYLNGKNIDKNIQLPILAISKDNIKEKLNTIKLNVLGIENEAK